MSSTPSAAKGFWRRSRSSKEETMAWSVGAGLEGKGVIVTGAAGGIGQAVSRAFATAGGRVMAGGFPQGETHLVLGAPRGGPPLRGGGGPPGLPTQPFGGRRRRP